jgi:tRNA (guanine-N7-)-methyltransferase
MNPFYGRKVARPLNTSSKNVLNDVLPDLSCHLKDLNDKIPSHTPIVMDIGFGTGDHLWDQYQKNPDYFFIAIDPFITGVCSFLKKIDAQNFNGFVLNHPAQEVVNMLRNPCIDTIFMLFLDPWPKKRHHKRRLIQNNFLKQLHTILKPNGQIYIATDHPSYQEWVEKRALDTSDLFVWRHIPRPPDWAQSRYEKKGSEQSLTAMYWCIEKIPHYFMT